jgi:HAMP domain-containing protein
MTAGMFLGPATWVFLLAQLGAALWWASGIDTDVDTLKQSTVTAERIGKLETKVDQMKETNGKLETAVNELVRELRRHP